MSSVKFNNKNVSINLNHFFVDAHFSQLAYLLTTCYDIYAVLTEHFQGSSDISLCMYGGDNGFCD